MLVYPPIAMGLLALAGVAVWRWMSKRLHREKSIGVEDRMGRAGHQNLPAITEERP